MKAEQQSDLGLLKQKLRADDRVSKEYYAAVRGKFSRGSDVAKKAFSKFVPQDSVANASLEGTAYYDTETKKIYMHYGADLSNERGSCATWFHEHGHMIDDMAGRISNDNEFTALIKDDYQSYMKTYGKANNLKTFDKVQAAISKDLNSMRKHSAVSDILEGISEENIRGIAGHKADYWKKDSGTLNSEAFAHMYEAQFDKTRYKEMQKYFPNALKYFENKLEEAVK